MLKFPALLCFQQKAMKLMVPILAVFISGSLFYSCEPEPNITPVQPVILSVKGGLFILNEGNFQSGNASVDYYNFENQTLSFNAFESVNKRKLGDVLQSMQRNGSLGYLIVNNSQKIEVINLNTLASINTITGFKSPRYMVVKNNMAYVSEYYGGGVKVVDLPTSTIVGTIPIQGNCDGLVLYKNKLYVTNASTSYVYIINTGSNTVMDSIAVGHGSNSLQLDADNQLWVLASGKKTSTAEEPGRLTLINPDLDSVVKYFLVSRQSDHGPIKLRIDTEKRVLYWINKSIYRHAIKSNALEEEPFVNSFRNNYWALNIDSLTKEIYVGDAIDYVQKSTINRYDQTGTLKGTFKAGYITGDFYFYYQ